MPPLTVATQKQRRSEVFRKNLSRRTHSTGVALAGGTMQKTIAETDEPNTFQTDLRLVVPTSRYPSEFVIYSDKVAQNVDPHNGKTGNPRGIGPSPTRSQRTTLPNR